MSLLNRIRGFFSRNSPLQKNTKKRAESYEAIEMSDLEWFDGSFTLNGGPWEYLSKKEIVAAEELRVASLHTRLDAVNAAARNAHRPPIEDIGQRENDGFVVVDTPHQMALNFATLLDSFGAEEPSFIF